MKLAEMSSIGVTASDAQKGVGAGLLWYWVGGRLSNKPRIATNRQASLTLRCASLLAGFLFACGARSQATHLSIDDMGELVVDCAGHVCLRSDDHMLRARALGSVQELLQGRLSRYRMAISATVLRGGPSPAYAEKFLGLLGIGESGIPYEKAALDGDRHAQMLVLVASTGMPDGRDVLLPRLRIPEGDRVMNGLGKLWDRVNRPDLFVGERQGPRLAVPVGSKAVLRWVPGTCAMLDAWTDWCFAEQLSSYVDAKAESGGGAAPATHANALSLIYTPGFLAWALAKQVGGLAVEQLLVAKRGDGRLLVCVVAQVDPQRLDAFVAPGASPAKWEGGLAQWASEQVDVLMAGNVGVLEQVLHGGSVPEVSEAEPVRTCAEDELWLRGPIAIEPPELGRFASVCLTHGLGKSSCQLSFSDQSDRDAWAVAWDRWRSGSGPVPRSMAAWHRKAWLSAAAARKVGELDVVIEMPDAGAKMLAATVGLLMPAK